nr:MAG TPA: hypothetical protein [Caudoviricetes sp.]
MRLLGHFSGYCSDWLTIISKFRSVLQVYPLRGKESRQDRAGEWLKYPPKIKRLVLFIYSTKGLSMNNISNRLLIALS